MNEKIKKEINLINNIDTDNIDISNLREPQRSILLEHIEHNVYCDDSSNCFTLQQLYDAIILRLINMDWNEIQKTLSLNNAQFKHLKHFAESAIYELSMRK